MHHRKRFYSIWSFTIAGALGLCRQRGHYEISVRTSLKKFSYAVTGSETSCFNCAITKFTSSFVLYFEKEKRIATRLGSDLIAVRTCEVSLLPDEHALPLEAHTPAMSRLKSNSEFLSLRGNVTFNTV